MLNLLLVDDEPLELEALKNYVDWKKLGMSQVYTAKNGKEAYDLFLEKEIHMIITDIKMPVMDGVALAKSIYAMKTGAKIVFLSGYDDFEYLKAAMSVHALDYIRKPFQVAEIEAVSEHVREAIEHDRLYHRSMDLMENQLMKQLCTSEYAVSQELNQAIRFHEEKKLPLSYGMIQVYGFFPQNVPDIVNSMITEVAYAFAEGNQVTFLVRTYVDFQDSAKRILNCIKHVSGKTCYAIYLKEKQLLDHLGEGYQILSSYETMLFYEEIGDVFPIIRMADLEYGSSEADRMKEREELEQFSRKLSDMAAEGQFGEREEVLSALFTHYKLAFLSREEVKISLLKMILNIENLDSGRNKELSGVISFPKMTKDLEEIFYFREYEEAIRRFFEEIAAYESKKQTGKNSYVVNKVREYVHREYANQITMEAIEEEVHLSKNYIRSIFKESTGQTILEYITNYRFETACKLLKDPKWKIKDVSLMVGYENVPYFCTIFTKRYKKSPNEYRKQYL